MLCRLEFKSILFNITVKHSNRTIIINTVFILNIDNRFSMATMLLYYVVWNCPLASHIDLLAYWVRMC